MWTAITLGTCLLFEVAGRVIHGISKQKRTVFLMVYSPQPFASGLGAAAIVLALSWIDFLTILPPRPVDLATFIHSLLCAVGAGVGTGIVAYIIALLVRLARRRRAERGAKDTTGTN
jgi:hypothetical protein